MSSDVQDISLLVRYMVEDIQQSQVPGDIWQYGGSNVFTLNQRNPISVTGVFINDVTTASYTFDTTSNKVTVTASMNTGDTVEIQYTYYASYSDAQLEAYVRGASVYLSVNNYYSFDIDNLDTFYPEITTQEKNLFAFIASVLAKPDNVTYRLPDMSIIVPKSMPTRDIISRAIAIFKHNTHGVFSVIGNYTYDNNISRLVP